MGIKVEPEKFPEMNCMTFASPADATKAAKMFNEMQEQIAALVDLVKLLQWGSCDGCGNHDFCPLCHSKATEFDDNWNDSPGKHKDDCPVKRMLG